MAEVAATSEAIEEIIDDFAVDPTRQNIRISVPKKSAETPAFATILADQLLDAVAYRELGLKLVDGLPCVLKPATEDMKITMYDIKVYKETKIFQKVWQAYHERNLKATVNAHE